MREEVFAFNSNGARLSGILSRPDTDAPPPRGVVLVHGWGGYRIGAHGMLAAMARTLAKAGLPALRFDLRGRGDSEGDADRVGLDDMIADTLAAGSALAEAAGVDRLGAVGHCSGGNIILGAAVMDNRFDRLLPISTFPFQEQMTDTHRAAYRRGKLGTLFAKALEARTWARIFRGEIRWGRVVKNATRGETASADAEGRNLKRSKEDIPGRLARWGGRALFIFGGADPADRASMHFYRTFSEEHNLAFEFSSIDGANHNFYSLEWEAELARRGAAFLSA